ncbi:MAG: histidine ammonia-lyase [Bacteroidota bacterium]
MKIHEISPDPLNFTILNEILRDDASLRISQRSLDIIDKCRAYLDEKMENSDVPVYGINTGFGSLCKVSITKNDLAQLQENLVKSHACGMGEEVDQKIVRLMMLFKVQALSLGNSGVRNETVEMITELYNRNIIPVVYELGSLGASGDLAPLAHMVLPMLGLGDVNYKGNLMPAADALKAENIKPLKLDAKEGLALLNGTQFMSAHGVHAIFKAFKLAKIADIIAALSLDAYDGRIDPFYASLHTVRPHKGQAETARSVRKLLEGSEMIVKEKDHVQDPYSFRCIPQVHGAGKDVINHVASVLITEINSVTDNPTIFPDEDKIVSGGNFHGQPLALNFDYLAMALAELGNISERRVYRLISGQRNLPEFLVANPGLNSGFMIPQYAAASIVSQNKQLCTPASVDSISSSNEQEDHVSMGANAATKLVKVVNNLERILAIELFAAAQAFEFQRPAKTSPYLEEFLANFRDTVPFVNEDKEMYKLIDKAVKFIQKGDFETDLV